jgi:organic radical activating enzyme
LEQKHEAEQVTATAMTKELERLRRDDKKVCLHGGLPFLLTNIYSLLLL